MSLYRAYSLILKSNITHDSNMCDRDAVKALIMSWFHCKPLRLNHPARSQEIASSLSKFLSGSLMMKHYDVIYCFYRK